jgi:hypothetical protein
MSDEKKTAPFQLRMRPSVKKAGLKAALDDNRSLSSLLETLLIQHLKAHGYLDASASAPRIRRSATARRG